MEFLAVVKRDCETCKLVEPVLAELRDALAVAVLRPLSPVYAQLSDQLYRQLNTVITGDISASTAMEQLQASSLRLEIGRAHV